MSQQNQNSIDSLESKQASQVHALGEKVDVPYTYSPGVLETFDNLFEGDYVVTLPCPEWTGLCPKTGAPDFGSIEIIYIPDRKLVESKSLKLYIGSFRNHGCFHESVVNLIHQDLWKLLDPKSLHVKGEFNPRGGIAIICQKYKEKGIGQERSKTSKFLTPQEGSPKNPEIQDNGLYL